MAIQYMELDPNAAVYSDDEIVGKINTATVKITRVDAIQEAALEESATFQKISEAKETKLDGIEDGAKDDQSGAEIKTAYEAEAGAFTNVKDAKLTGIAEGAEVNPADLAALDAAQDTKLNGIEDGAKDDQSGAEIKTAYEGEANAFNDTKDTKLTGIEEGAEVSPTDDEVVGQINTAAVPITREEALSQADLKLVKSEPVVGEHIINYIVRKADGKLEADYEDTPES